MPDRRSEESDANTAHNVAFLPFLRLKRRYTIAGVEFLPLRDEAGAVPQPLQSGVKAIETILSGYVDRHGKPLTNCVVATLPEKRWDIAREDFATVRWAASLLFLAGWASNQYLTPFGGNYVNSTMFRVIGQAFSGIVPDYIAIPARRRDGGSLDGGYKHGEVKFPLPAQCSIRDAAVIDEGVLLALDKAHAAESPVVDRLRTAVPFVQLANSDEDWMPDLAEAILMGSAFEQLLQGNASAFKLGRKFGVLFGSCGSVTVADAKKVRSNIEIDTSTPERAAAQPEWWVHRKWMEELYDVRSKVVHHGSPGSRQWGWSLFEHLVMSAHVFPLTTKLLLQRERYYALTDDDRIGCRAVDKLLASPRWWNERSAARGASTERTWSEIIWRTKTDEAIVRAIADSLRRTTGQTGGHDQPE
jgi:hypothetical protein